MANAKVLCRYFDYDIEKIKSADVEELSEIDGVGEVLAGGIRAYFTKNKGILASYHAKPSQLAYTRT